jgi:hypothetical protein
MNNTSLLGNGWQRVVLLLLAGMASGLIVADSLDQLQPAVAEIQTAHQPFLQITMPQSLLITCVLPNDTGTFPKPACSVQIG